MKSLINSTHYADTINQQTVESLIQQAIADGAKSLFILCCDSDDDLSFLNKLLPTLELSIFGGVFPGILLDDHVIETGVMVVGLMDAVETRVYTDVSKTPKQEFELSLALNDCHSLMVFIDGLARNIDFMIEQLFHHVGNEKTIIGGGAGSLSFQQKPCIICNQGILVDAMLVAATSQKIQLAIGHGWEKLAGPFLVTQVDDNRIDSLNFQPALKVYQQVVSEHSELDFASSDFFEISSSFPFGIDRLDDDLLVRDPVAADGTSLICVGKIPENTMLYILKGEPDKLIAAACDAVDKEKQASIGSQVFTDGVLFDCVSRKLFLQEQYSQELININAAITDGFHLVGALVLGEIASGKTGTINFHNKTAVTGLVCGDLS